VERGHDGAEAADRVHHVRMQGATTAEGVHPASRTGDGASNHTSCTETVVKSVRPQLSLLTIRTGVAVSVIIVAVAVTVLGVAVTVIIVAVAVTVLGVAVTVIIVAVAVTVLGVGVGRTV
jgi:hypothetical protein